jgi:hypothetical protein
LYNQVQNFYPTTAGIAQLRTFLTEQVQERQSRGIRSSLGRTVWGSDTPAYQIVLMFPDLATLQTKRAEMAESTVGFQARNAPLLRKTNETSLLEVLVTNNAPPTPGGFRQRVVMTATLGKIQDLRASLVDWTNAEQERGARVSLLSKVEGPGGTFVLNRFFENLSGLEEWRAERSTNADRRAWFEKRDALLAQPGDVSITESLVSPPAV